MTAKQLIYETLRDYAPLQALVGQDSDGEYRIYQSWHDSQRGYPQVTITRLSESDSYSGDNSSQIFSTVFQLDVWTNLSPSATELEVKRAIRNTLKESQFGNIRVIDDTFDTTDKLHNVKLEVPIYLDQSIEN